MTRYTDLINAKETAASLKDRLEKIRRRRDADQSPVQKGQGVGDFLGRPSGVGRKGNRAQRVGHDS